MNSFLQSHPIRTAYQELAAVTNAYFQTIRRAVCTITETSCARTQSGFTLIEIVVVVAIAALILVGVLLFVPSAQKNRRDVDRRGVTGKVAAVVEQMASEAAGTYPTLAQVNTRLGAEGTLKDPNSGSVLGSGLALVDCASTTATNDFGYTKPNPVTGPFRACSRLEGTAANYNVPQ